MKIRLFITLALGATLAQAMEESSSGDTPLHAAAKVNDHATCFAILTQVPQTLPLMPPLDAMRIIQKTHNSDVSLEEQTEEYKEAVLKMSQFTVALQKQMNSQRIALAKVLRTAVNNEGRIPRECITDNTNEALCKLLDPSNNGPFEQPAQQGPLFQPGETINIGGQAYQCTAIKKVFDPNNNSNK